MENNDPVCASLWIACLHFTNSVALNDSLGKAIMIKRILVLIAKTFSYLNPISVLLGQSDFGNKEEDIGVTVLI